MIILNFVVQLTIWNAIFSTDQLTDLYRFLVTWNLGIVHLQSANFGTMLANFIWEILVLLFVMLHIHVETQAGMFGVKPRE